MGGENDRGLSDEVHLFRYNPTRHILVQSALPSLPVAVTNGCAAYHNDIVYFAGGETANSVSNQFFALNVKQPGKGWIHLPALPVAVSHALLRYQKNGSDPCLYLIGGRQKLSTGISDLFHSVYAYSLTTLRWIKKQSLPFPLSAASGVPYGKSGIMVFGGDTGETFHQVELAMAAIHAENDPVVKQKLTDQKNQLLASHPGFSKAIWYYDVASDEWSSGGLIPFDSPVTTTACIWKSTIILPCGEIRAGIRTPKILSINLKKR
jgi:N-acetylneuraminic acid mutarotase